MVVKYCAQSLKLSSYGWFTSLLEWNLTKVVDGNGDWRLLTEAMESLAEMSYCAAYVTDVFESAGGRSGEWNTLSEVRAKPERNQRIQESQNQANRRHNMYTRVFILHTTTEQSEVNQHRPSSIITVLVELELDLRDAIPSVEQLIDSRARL